MITTVCSAIIFCLPFLWIGTKTDPVLDAWHGENRTSEQMLVTDNTGRGALRTFADVPEWGYNWGLANAARTTKYGQAVGSLDYGEIASTGSGFAWGSNAVGATYSPTGTAIGIEINGLNRSGSDQARVYGGYIVNGGNAPTLAGLVVETSLAESAGQPLYGVWIKSDATTAARNSGVRVDKVDSGEAFRTVAGQRIALSEDGTTFLRFNPTSNRIQLVRHGVVVGSW